MRKWRPTWLIWASIALHLFALIALIVAFDTWRWAVGIVLANHLLLTLLGMWPRSHSLGSNWTKLPGAAAARNEIALTIDDGPDPLVTPQVLDILEQHHIQATFFCVGEKAARYPDLCRDIVRRGHTVENHTQRHSHYFAFMGPGGFTRELQDAQHTLTSITGQPPLFFRAPAGIRSPLLEPVLAKLGLQLASWTARGFDTRIGNATQVKNRLLKQLHAGTILLLHDGNAARTAEGIPVIIEILPALLEAARTAQLRFVSLRAARA
ncbi:MAG: polysaccharide deacetylase family protein [Thiobacillus sp.]